jgi:TonB family protein
MGSAVETDVKILGGPAKMFQVENKDMVTTRWVMWDIDRWFEMAVIRRKSDAVSKEKFPYSLSLADNSAKDIGSGSNQILGDKSTADTKPADAYNVPQDEEIVIVSKPRPGYTDIARQHNVQGTVTLQVTYLRNGAIGPITVVKGLPDGITELTIAVARRISFLPERKNGIPQTVVKQIQYTFSIY